MKEKSPNLWWRSQVVWKRLYHCKVGTIPGNDAIWFVPNWCMPCWLVFNQLVCFDFSPQMGVIKKIYKPISMMFRCSFHDVQAQFQLCFVRCFNFHKSFSPVLYAIWHTQLVTTVTKTKKAKENKRK